MDDQGRKRHLAATAGESALHLSSIAVVEIGHDEDDLVAVQESAQLALAFLELLAMFLLLLLQITQDGHLAPLSLNLFDGLLPLFDPPGILLGRKAILPNVVLFDFLCCPVDQRDGWFLILRGL